MRKNKIENISNYILVNENLFVSEGRVVIDTTKKVKLDDFKFDTASLMSFGEYLIVPISEETGNTMVYNSTTGTKIQIKGSCDYLRESPQKNCN
ncbi:hypothetical protein [Arcticibacterium luteifluviistationis]|uniref:Uncharacterized protein n=1 Tax=Arcticibacterium luteifluviistationis TaxID=1784714 RepID=A0A2Z4GA07_9BACT|nr:hypothetical protein [Arcticibacterium luteifluviistationis]AWV98072.1 hypothetical protein DJ013_07755 [Arcticibacterium luteifluviistationis]